MQLGYALFHASAKSLRLIWLFCSYSVTMIVASLVAGENTVLTKRFGGVVDCFRPEEARNDG